MRTSRRFLLCAPATGFVAGVACLLVLTASTARGSANRQTQSGWWWTQAAAEQAVSPHGEAGGLLSPIYWEYGCAGVGERRFYSARWSDVRPNGTSPEAWAADTLTDGLNQWKFRRFLCIGYRHGGAPPIVFWLTTGPGEFELTISPVRGAPVTLSRSYTW